MGKFVIKPRAEGANKFNLVSTSREIILTSIGYASKADCKIGIESVRVNSLEDKRFENFMNKNGH